MAEVGNLVFVIGDIDKLEKREILRRNNDGSVVILAPSGAEWNAEACVVYQLLNQHQTPLQTQPETSASVGFPSLPVAEPEQAEPQQEAVPIRKVIRRRKK
jgi:hypothetical protein